MKIAGAWWIEEHADAMVALRTCQSEWLMESVLEANRLNHTFVTPVVGNVAVLIFFPYNADEKN